MPTYRRVAKRPVVAAKPTPKVDPDAVSKADLVGLAEARGIDSSGTKAEIAARLNR